MHPLHHLSCLGRRHRVSRLKFQDDLNARDKDTLYNQVLRLTRVTLLSDVLCSVARDAQDNAFINFFPDHSQREAEPDHVTDIVFFLFWIAVMKGQASLALALGTSAPPLVFLYPFAPFVSVVFSKRLRREPLMFGIVAHSSTPW